MTTQRLEAFSDAVIAIVITIMVLELPTPHGERLAALRPVLPVILTYILSFVFLGIYWNNHHHMMHVCERVNGAVLWANLHLLFWLSLVPFVTRWLGESHLAPLATAVYGVVLLMAAVAWLILQGRIVALEGPASGLARAIGRDLKGKASAACYVAAISLAFVEPWVSAGLFIAVALMWLVPDRRFEALVRP
jgi:uncharacterized membrane protein